MVTTASSAMNRPLRDLPSRSRGLFLGAAVGDALGWPQEQNSGIVGGNRARTTAPVLSFRDWTRYSGGPYNKFTESVGAGEYSDDTQLILASARSVLTGEPFTALIDNELPLFLLYQRGAGGATLRACRSWGDGSPPWGEGKTQKAVKQREQYFSAGGNGAAMRMAAYAVTGAAQSSKDLVETVVRDGITTHGHPRALVGAAVYAVALHTLLTSEETLEFGGLAARLQADESWQDPQTAYSALPSEWHKAASEEHPGYFKGWSAAVTETIDLLSTARLGLQAGILGDDTAVLEQLGCFDRRVNGAGTVTAVGAIFLASRNAAKPRDGLIRAAYLERADTDTLASMTAGLLGALHGATWLEPLSTAVQDHDYIVEVADRCTSLALGEAPGGDKLPAPISNRELQSFREFLTYSTTAPAYIPGGREVRSGHRKVLNSVAGKMVKRWSLDVLGQTLIVHVTDIGPLESIPSAVIRRDAELRSSPEAMVQRISIMAMDLDAIEEFYGPSGLGLVVRRIDHDQLAVGRALRFVRPNPEVGPGFSFVSLEVRVQNLEVVLRRLDRRFGRPGIHRLIDPAGNDVRLLDGRDH